MNQYERGIKSVFKLSSTNDHREDDLCGYGDGPSDREGDSSEESDFGDDLYKNEEDRQKLVASRGVRSSAISADRAAAKDDALNELRAKSYEAAGPGSSQENERCIQRSQSDGEGSNGGMLDSVPTFEDIKEITIRRSKLAKWLMEPFFTVCAIFAVEVDVKSLNKGRFRKGYSCAATRLVLSHSF
ncbi:unnamed protein product [Arabis nemorensis]|uniref:Plus3 domain-containing protein n=1 Tax=Arabis nemorensis TaxID=586526 RepID=A0A565CWM9_9BRAS|nr:unnamed protein product [Arabis nemorensis]